MKNVLTLNLRFNNLHFSLVCHLSPITTLVWTRKLCRSIAHFTACSLHGLQVREEFRNLLPYSTVHEPNFIFNIPKNEGRNQLQNWFLAIEWWEYSILLKHASMQRGNLVPIHRKATFPRVEYSQIMTRNNASCINPLQLYHALCAFTNHSYWLYRYEQDRQWKFSRDALKKAGFYFAVIISCVLALNLYGCEWCRRRKNPPSVSDPRAGQREGGKQQILGKQTYFPKSLRKKINTKTRKWHCSSLRSEVVFARFQPFLQLTFIKLKQKRLYNGNADMIPTGQLTHSALIDETSLEELGCDEEPQEVQLFWESGRHAKRGWNFKGLQNKERSLIWAQLKPRASQYFESHPTFFNALQKRALPQLLARVAAIWRFTQYHVFR